MKLLSPDVCGGGAVVPAGMPLLGREPKHD